MNTKSGRLISLEKKLKTKKTFSRTIFVERSFYFTKSPQQLKGSRNNRISFDDIEFYIIIIIFIYLMQMFAISLDQEH